MIRIRKSEERGHFNHGWLDTHHTFSFADYYDPDHRGFRSLRVINEDFVQPGEGFPTHPHRDMEIITYVIAGSIEHRDSLGNGSIIRAGEIQRMTAGRGVMHSEFNSDKNSVLHLMQIWIRPSQEGLPPAYEQKMIAKPDSTKPLQLIATQDGQDGSVLIHQDANLTVGGLEPGNTVVYPLASGRHAWVQVITGLVNVNGIPLTPGDGAAISNERTLTFQGPPKSGASAKGEFLLFDLA